MPVGLADERALRGRHLPELAIDDGDRPPCEDHPLDGLIAERLLVAVPLAITVEDATDRSIAPIDDADPRARIEILARPDENVASPASLVKSIEHIWRADGLKKESRDAGLRILYQVPGQMRDAVPARVRVASKTGTLDGVRAEAAIVELEGRPYALAAMTTYLRNDPDGERAIHDVADAVFSYFDRLATGGKYGRRSPS